MPILLERYTPGLRSPAPEQRRAIMAAAQRERAELHAAAERAGALVRSRFAASQAQAPAPAPKPAQVAPKPAKSAKPKAAKPAPSLAAVKHQVRRLQGAVRALAKPTTTARQVQALIDKHMPVTSHAQPRIKHTRTASTFSVAKRPAELPLSDADFDAAMGIATRSAGIRQVGSSVEYGILSKAEAARRLRGAKS